MVEQNPLDGFNATALRVGVTGAMRWAALGTALPTNLKQKYDTSVFRNMGYIAENVEIEFDDDSTGFIPWQSVSEIRKDVIKSIKTFKFTLWEFTPDNFSFYLGCSLDQLKKIDGGYQLTEREIPNFERGLSSLDVIDGSKAMRIISPNSQLSGREGLVFEKGEAIGFPVELSVYPAAAEDYPDSPDVAGSTTTWVFNDTWFGSNIDIKNDQEELAVSTVSLAPATKGEKYERTLAASGGVTPYTWTKTAGDLPAGITLSTDGKLSGTPSTAGTKSVTVQVKDAGGATATKELSLEVKAGA